MILVTGATGMIGRYLVAALAEKGLPVRAFLRRREGASILPKHGVQLVTGDLDDAAAVAAAMQGVEKAFLLPPAGLYQLRRESNVIAAARSAGVKHLVKLSIIGADMKSTGAVPQWHGMAERRLEDSGVPFTHLRPNLLMQTLFWFVPSIRRIGALHLPARDAVAALVDSRDVAAAAAAVLTGGDHEGKTYRLTGPDALSFHDVASELSAVAGHTISYEETTPAAFKKEVLGWGFPDPYCEAVLSVWRSIGGGAYAEVTDDVARLTGRPPLPFHRFAADHAGMFRVLPA